VPEGVHRKPRCCNGTDEADLWGTSARSPVAFPILRVCARIGERTSCTLPTECCLPVPWYIVPTGKSSNVPWTRCAPLEPEYFLEPRSPGDGVNVQSAGAPPSGAKPRGWILSSHQTRSLRTHGA